MGESVNARREWVGRVVSNKMNKTVVVEIERSVIHPLYRKVLRRVTKFKAHDEDKPARSATVCAWSRPGLSVKISICGLSRSWKKDGVSRSRSCKE